MSGIVPASGGVPVPSVFGDLTVAAQSVATNRLLTVAPNYLPGVTLPLAYIADKIAYAENDVQRRLRCYLTPRQMYPQGTTSAQLAAFVAAGVPPVEEPGYDYDPSMFMSDTWGLIEVRQRPIISVQSIVFAYPSLADQVFTVPPEWVRMDAKYGKIQLVPTQNLAALPLSSYLMQVMGGGRRVPFMVLITYQAGLKNAAGDYPDLLDLIKKYAVLNILDDQFMPSSGSTSADGLSQSVSWDADKHRDALDKRLDVIRQSLAGIRLMVC